MDHLRERFEEYREKFAGKPVPRPPHWGGFRLTPGRFVFWRAGAHRLHSRWAFERDREEESWQRALLNP